MWVFYAIRVEMSTKVTYMLGHSHIAGTLPGASIVNMTVWVSPNQQQQPGEFHFNSCIINITSPDQFDDIVRSTQVCTGKMTDIVDSPRDDDVEEPGYDIYFDLDFEFDDNDDDDDDDGDNNNNNNGGGGGDDDNKGNTCYEAGSSSQPNTVPGGDSGPCQSIETPTGASCSGE